MVKSYLDLNDIDRVRALEFLNRKNESGDISDIEKEVLSKVYGFGCGVLFYCRDNEIIGKLSVVLEVVERLKTAYLHSIDIVYYYIEDSSILLSLVNSGIELANSKNAETILLGIRNEKVLETTKVFKAKEAYSAYKMELKDRGIKCEVLELVPLNNENADMYIEIYNDSFMDMPHGTYIEADDIKERIEKGDIKAFFVKDLNKEIGFVEISIEDGVGQFDIGLCKKYRGKGYGNRLLETAIQYLNSIKVEKIMLTVIEKNSIAFNIYCKRGFRVESTLSKWLVLK